MSMNRRQFIVLSAATLAAGCAANQPVHLQPAAIDAGPACTHRGCKVNVEADNSFYCPCHGSSFDPAGRVTYGPAIYALPVLPTSVDSRGHLIIRATVI